MQAKALRKLSGTLFLMITMYYDASGDDGDVGVGVDFDVDVK